MNYSDRCVVPDGHLTPLNQPGSPDLRGRAQRGRGVRSLQAWIGIDW